MKEQADIAQKAGYHRHDDTHAFGRYCSGSAFGHLLDFDSALVGERLPQNPAGTEYGKLEVNEWMPFDQSTMIS